MHVANIYSSPWICAIENILNLCGFTYIWLQQCKQSDTWVDYILKQNIKDQFIQRWTSDINNSPKCFNYKLYKQTFGFEKYFDILPYPKYFIFVKFRTCKIISYQSRLVDIPIFPDKSDCVHCVIKDALETNFIICSSVQN